MPLAGMLSDAVTEQSSAELPRGAESTQVTELTDRFPDGKVASGVMIYARDSGVTAADRAKVEADRTALAPLAVEPIPQARPSADGKALMVVVGLADGDDLSDTAKKVRTQMETALPGGLRAELTGSAGRALDTSEMFASADATALIITVVVVTLLLLVIYRSPVLWLLPLVNAFLALQLANAIAYLLAEYAGMFVAPGAASILTVLCFGVSTDYALLLLARYREELRRHADRHEAMAVALRRAVPAIAASAATVGLALLALLAADMGFNYSLGPVGAIGIAAGLAAMITLLPALLVIFGRWVFWPMIPRYGSADTVHRSMWGRIGDKVAVRPRLVWVTSALILGTIALAALSIETGLDDEHHTTTTPGSAAGQRLVAAHYPAGQARPMQVIADAADAETVAARLRGVRGVAEVRSPRPSTDGTLARVDAVLSDPPDSPAAAASVDRARAALRDLPQAHARVGGATAQDLDIARTQGHDRRVVIPLVLAVVLLVLIVLLRALVAPLILIASVVLSYFTALGASWLIFKHLFGFPAMDVQVALMGFLFLVALGVDYNIFLVSRVREETVRLGHRDGVLRGLAVTGGVISSAGLVLAATFGTLGALPMVMFVEMGVLVALGVLIDTFLIRSIMVPALALDLGRLFWWPGRLARPITVSAPEESGEPGEAAALGAPAERPAPLPR
ncbi:MMPL family transporter [Actinomadura sp. HBU206391]|nr:MMPL family transporter [Actinomadura sp. HBU206391]